MLGLGGDDPRRLGPYRLRAVIGDGGMGRVYLATSPAGRAVAVKVIGAGLANQPNYRERFAREARAAMSVSGLYTASVVDADTTGERPYIATEYVPAPSLADAVKTAGPLPPATVTALAGGLAEALAAIHRAGLVHRDVKPHNILLAPDGPVVIDFGIALGDDSLTSLTAVGMAVGSPGYIAPEVLSGRDPTAAADMFALACVLVYAARGVGPFGKGDALAVAHRTVSDAPDLAGVADFIKTLVTPMLVREPAARPTPAQLLEHLEVVGQETVLHDALWLPESVRGLLGERRQEVQRLLAGNSEQAVSAAPTVMPRSAPPRPPAYSDRPHVALTPPTPLLRPPMPPPAAASHRTRNALLATGGAVVVAAVTATAVVLAQGNRNCCPGPSTSHTSTASVSPVAQQSAVDTSSATEASSAPAASTPASAASSGDVLSYKPGTYKVNRLVATDLLDYSSVYLVDVKVNSDGSVQADLRYTNNTSTTQPFGCTYDTPDEGKLATDDASVKSSATACTDDPSFTKNVPAGGSLASYDTFDHAPAGSGTWTYTISSFEYNGSISGIDVPTQ
ncbi:serine/threonine-protein kinase [Actinospica robiniae]|uniref:serine/threonine-protein kinase n=1 Tax=Actinospica robiniae TaxID=304901 RepID=UPI0003FAF1CA|nr:serine/threonine-protein kinase [Actinospica robiniae]